MPNANDDPRLVIAMGLRPKEADLLHYRRGPGDRFDGTKVLLEAEQLVKEFPVRAGVRREESATLLQGFFASRR